jgi:erythromycin esterase-like protein
MVSRLLRAAALCLLATAAACGDSPTSPVSSASDEARLVEAVAAGAVPLTGAAADYDPLLALTAGARYALLGEQTHGTHEFYRERARISRRLVEEQAFTAVAVEADWPEAERVNLYLRGGGTDAAAERALGNFATFPRWMWANADVRDFVGWLRERNAAVAEPARVGFYGLDLQSMFESLDAVVRYLEGVDPAAAARASGRYACFNAFRTGAPESYGLAIVRDSVPGCEAQAKAQLAEMEERYAAAPTASPAALDALFSALMNARAAERGEAYYRAWARGGPESWNLRDRNMTETLERIVAHGARLGRAVKVVVWAHNTHVGDNRATGRGASEVNLGMLMRQAHPGEVVLTGFTTYRGTVMAAPSWGAAPVRYTLPAAATGSYADLFHRTGRSDFLLVLRGQAALAEPLATARRQRAVGVVFDPDRESEANYFAAKLAEQFDAVVHVDQTTAVDPL